MAVGTPVYMSPEQAVGDNVGPTSDLYSLGCMLYEMLAGEPPFNAKSAQALMARHAMEAVPSIRIVRETVPEEVEDAIFAAMAKVPADRPQTAAKFTEILGAPIGTTANMRAGLRQSASRRVSTGTRQALRIQGPWWKRRGVQIGIGGGVLGLAGVAFLLLSKGGGGGSPADLERARRIAVLYFAAPEGSSELRSVADRITEGVIGTLSQIPELKVRSAQAVAPFGNVFSDSVGTVLDVGSLITGSVEPAGPGRVRISTRVLEASSGSPIERTSIEIARDSLFAAEDSVAGEIARSLRQIVGSEINLRESRSRTSNLAAWTAVQRVERLRKDAREAEPAKAKNLLATADSLLAQAASADTRWIEPLVLRGNLAIDRARLESEPAARQMLFEEGLGYARNALGIDGRNAAALELEGSLKYREWQLNNSPTPAARKALLDGAEQDLLAAVSRDPARASAYVLLSRLYYDKQDVTEAHNQAAKAYDADRYLTNADFVLERLFYTAYDTHSFTQATKWCDEGGARFPRNYQFSLCRLWLMLVPDAPVDVPEAWRLAARVDSLVPAADSALRFSTTRTAQLIVGGAIGKTSGGAPNPLADSAKRVLERTRVPTKDDPTHELEGYEAVMRVRIGDYPEALRLLTRYVATNPDHSFRVGGDVHWWWEPLRQMPQFQRLLAAQDR
jgi:serine/threonine-protein kinase